MKNLKNITTAIIAVVLFTNIAAAQSAGTVTTQEPFTVKYLGNQDNYLLFQVEINTAETGFSLLKITDKEIGVLYSQNQKSKAKFQTFKIEKNNDQELSFKLVSGKKVYTKIFSSNTILVEKTTVNEKDVVVL